MKKKILLVTNIDGNGGSEQFIKVTAKYLKSRGYSLALYTLKRTKKINAFKDAGLKNLNNGWGFFKSLIKLQQAVKHYKPDFVFSFLNKSAHVVRIMNKRFDFQHVLFFNSINLTFLDRLFYKHLLPIRKETICIADSNITRHFITKTLSVDIDLIIPPFFCPDHIIDLPIPYLSDTPKPCITFGVISRLSKEKGLASLLHAVKLLCEDKSIPHFQLRIAGDGHEYKNYVNYIHKYELPVEIIGHIQDIYQFLRNIDIYIQPSHYEGFCLSIHEALSLGLFVIASDNSGEITFDKTLRHNNLFFRTGDARAIYDTIKKFFATPKAPLREKQRKNKNYILTHYPHIRFNHTLEKLLQILN